MDIVEFAERFMGVELEEWQKAHLRILDRLPQDAKITMAPNGRVYIYMKENANGNKNSRQSTYHSGYKSRVHAYDELDRSSSWG